MLYCYTTCEIDLNKFWIQFRLYIEHNQEEVTRFADAFVANYLDLKSNNVSVGHTLRLHLMIWNDWSINVSNSVKEKIIRLNKEQWNPQKIQRLNALSHLKSQQFELIDANWVKMVDYMTNTLPLDFQVNLQLIESTRPSNIPVSILNEIGVLSRKSIPELQRVLLRTRAFTSLLRSTGMRSTTALSLMLEQFTEVADMDGLVLLHRMENKCGSIRNVQKPIFVCIAPHKDPKLDPLVHIAEYVYDIECSCIFTEGFVRKSNQDVNKK